MAIKENSDRARFSSTIDKDLKEKLGLLSKDTRIPVSKLLDEAIELLIEHHNKSK